MEPIESVSVCVRETERGRERDWFIIRNCLTYLWKLTSPRVCSQQAGEWGELMCSFCLKAGRLETQEIWYFRSSSKAGKHIHTHSHTQCPCSMAVRQKEYSLSFSVLISPLTDWIRITHIREGNLVYCLLIQMLISPRNTDTPRIMFNQVYGHPLAQPSWHKISHHIIFHLTLIPITNGYCLVISFTWSDV